MQRDKLSCRAFTRRRWSVNGNNESLQNLKIIFEYEIYLFSKKEATYFCREINEKLLDSKAFHVYFPITMRKLTHEEISLKRTSLEDISNRPRLPIYAMVDNVRSLYNVGSIFRSSDGALIEKLFLVGFTPYPPRKEIDKTALGATKTVPWEYHKDSMTVIDRLKKEKIKICALELTTENKPYYELKRDDFPLCVVVGNEITGVSKEIIREADMAIEIPMFGNKQSLNVAVAYGIVVYDCVRTLTSR
jgi:rRNA methylases